MAMTSGARAAARTARRRCPTCTCVAGASGATGYLPPKAPSARGSGLPLFAGIITPADIRSGAIRHALAISVPGPAATNYVQPASVTDGNGRTTSLPEGARLRLSRACRSPGCCVSSPVPRAGAPPGSSTTRCGATERRRRPLRRADAVRPADGRVGDAAAQRARHRDRPRRTHPAVAQAAQQAPLPDPAAAWRRGIGASADRLRGRQPAPPAQGSAASETDAVASLPGASPQEVPGGTGLTSSSTATQVQGTAPLTPSHPATPGA